MSDDFLENFMHKNTLNGYMGIKPGMTEKEVERIVENQQEKFILMVWIMNLLSMEIWQLITIHTLKKRLSLQWNCSK